MGAMYHVAPSELRDRIAAEGLKAQPVSDRWGPAVSTQPAGIYVFDTPEGARQYRDTYGGDVWQVDGEGAQADPGGTHAGSYYLPTDRPAALLHCAEDLDGKCWQCGINPKGVSGSGHPMSICNDCLGWHPTPRTASRLSTDVIRDLLLPEVYMTFEKMASMQHEGQWADVAAKAKRLVQSGNVTILRNAPHHVMAHVIGDHGEYNCEISRHDPSSQIIEQWNCECPWAQFAFDRTRKWKKLEGRVCSHVLAAYWKAKSTPMDREEVAPGQKLPPGQKQPGQQPLPGAVPGAGGAPEVAPPPSSMPGEAQPEGAPDQIGPEPLKTQQDLTTPKQPESPFQTPKVQPNSPQYEQLQLFDVTAPPGMQPTPQAAPVSVPGGRPATPGNPIAFPGTFSHFVPMMVVHSREFVYAKDAMSEYFEQQRQARRPIYVQLLSNVTLEQSGGKMPMPGAVPYGTSSEGVALYNVMDLGYNPETGMRENSDVNSLQGAPAQTGQHSDVPAGRRGEVLDYDDSLKMAYVIIPLNYPEGGDVRLHPHALVGWVDYKDLKPLPAAGNPWRK